MLSFRRTIPEPCFHGISIPTSHLFRSLSEYLLHTQQNRNLISKRTHLNVPSATACSKHILIKALMDTQPPTLPPGMEDVDDIGDARTPAGLFAAVRPPAAAQQLSNVCQHFDFGAVQDSFFSGAVCFVRRTLTRRAFHGFSIVFQKCKRV